MVGGKNKNKVRSFPVTPEQNQEVDFEEEGKIDKVSKHTQHPPGNNRCAIGSDSVSGDSISPGPCYSKISPSPPSTYIYSYLYTNMYIYII
jgi:hypothetical protein